MHAFFSESMSSAEEKFLVEISTRVTRFVHQLIQTNRPECMIERHEFRKNHDKLIGEKIFSEIFSIENQKAYFERDVDTLRVSLKLAWLNPEGCWTSVMDQQIQTAFYRRLASSRSVKYLRTSPLVGYDVTLIFTHEDDAVLAGKFLSEIIPLWRTLTRQIRVRQIIGNRRCAHSLFQSIVRPFSGPETLPGESASYESPNRSPAKSIRQDRSPGWSVRTDAFDLCSVGDIDDLVKDVDEAAGSGFLLIGGGEFFEKGY